MQNIFPYIFAYHGKETHLHSVHLPYLLTVLTVLKAPFRFDRTMNEDLLESSNNSLSFTKIMMIAVLSQKRDKYSRNLFMVSISI